MKRLLLLAYYFPPTGGAGTQRALSFGRHLPGMGWQPCVVAGPDTSSGRWTPTDDSLLTDLDPSTEVVRVGGPVPAQSSGTRARAERWLGFRSPFDRWWTEEAVAAGQAAGPVDAIVATMSPYESAAAAARLSRALGVPWIADLRDPWALDEVMAYPTALHRARELRRMRGLLASAKAVVMNTPEAAREVNSFPEMRTTRVVSIPNGFEPADFDGPPPTRTDGAFRIVHTGYLHTELGREHQRTARLRHALGGTLGSVDLLTRSHVYLLEAVQALRRSGATGGRDIEVHLAGVMSDADREVAAVPGVHLHGYLPHADTIGLMRSADLLFLPMQNLDGGTRSRIVPGKTYEYLASGRPLLAAVPDGDARDLVGSTPGHWLCRPDDVDGMAAAITAQAKLKQAGDPGPGMPAGFERYSRHALAGELAALLDDVAGARRAGRSRVATR